VAGVPTNRSAWLATAFASYAAFVFAAVIGLLPDLPGVVTVVMLLGVMPFLIGALVGRAWAALAVFVLVAGTALLPDRTVVETTANSATYTIYDTSLAPTLMFAMVSSVAALAGVAAGEPLRVARNPVLLGLVDSWIGRLVLMVVAYALGGAPLLAAIVAGLLLRTLQARR
jgi:hypothetical protein